MRRGRHDCLQQAAQEHLWDSVSRWVDAGHYVTSAGTDMAFHLASRLAGRAVAEVAAQAAEYDWHCEPEQPIFYPQQARAG